MAALANLTSEERIGLLVAGAAHVAIAWWLVTQQPPPPPPAPKLPERMVVSISSDVGLVSTAPDAVSEAARPARSSLDSAPQSEPVPRYDPPPVPRPTPSAAPTPSPRPTPTPSARATRTPRATPTPTPRATRAARATPTPSASSRPRATPTPTASSSPRRRETGFDGAFSGGGTSETSSDTGTQAETIGPRERSAIGDQVRRQLRPHWQAPQGVDAELLTTTVRFSLNRDGSLAGSPTCTSQTGETASNRNQLATHCERAIRAVRLAAPFNLPERLYDGWRTINSTFDRRL